VPGGELLKFTGHERDYDLSQPTNDNYLDYMHARYYDSRRGRFLSVDPVLGNAPRPQTWNRYAYVANNPINRVDPDGRNWFDIDGKWQWHKGADYTVNKHTYHSDYTHLLVAQAIGPNAAGGVNFRLTLYNQNTVARTGFGFSGGAAGMQRIAAGNYMIRTDIRDAHGPNNVNPQSSDHNPPQWYGIQAIRPDALPDPATGLFYNVHSAYGSMRARLNPMDGQRDAGDYFHGQEPDANNAGATHGCLCYGRDYSFINYLWSLPPEHVPVAVDVPVTPP
jgi:RHS repeat-associated protein